MLFAISLLILSVVILYFGAEISLDSSEKIGKKLGLSPLAIGMLLVGFGTSLPELFVGHIAGLQGKIDIATGSLIGSNIANMLFILGVCGLFTKMSLSNKKLMHQILVHFVLGVTLVFVLKSESLTVFSALPLLLIAFVYLYLLYADLKNDKTDYPEDQDFKPVPVLIKLIAGFSMLYLGGEILVKAGTDLCIILNISEYIISAIFIALGTSFPELVTSIIAAKKKKDSDLIIGNIIGSNLFNCAFILGSLGIYNFKLTADYSTELALLIAGSIILLLISILKKHFNYVTSFIFLSGYVYIVGFWLKIF